jgi:hypothetical protein
MRVLKVAEYWNDGMMKHSVLPDATRFLPVPGAISRPGTDVISSEHFTRVGFIGLIWNY